VLPTKLLLVEDFEPFRHFICSVLEREARFQIIGQAYDGFEAIHKAEELQPDLILLDISLPKLNGIEAARQIRQLSPNSKIVFVSMNNCPETAEAALRTGAHGYVHKTRARSHLPAAIDAVLGGKQFVSTVLGGYRFRDISGPKTSSHHEVQFYSDDTILVDGFTHFIATALKAGNAAIAMVTKSHRDSLLQKLKAECVDVDDAIRRGACIVLDAADALSSIMVDGLPNSARFSESISGLIEAACKAAKARHPRVAFCGERVGLLWVNNETDAAIRLEQLCNDLSKSHEVDILCAYPLSSFHCEEDKQQFKRICAYHSAVCFQ
jgi:DNA-binding NarL/FixJ family response regulator